MQLEAQQLDFGGYSAGTVTLERGTVLHVYVGGHGTTTNTGTIPGGFNGGGNADGFMDGNNGSGGGATDIRIGTDSLFSRAIVAGGGGGNVLAGTVMSGGHGGGTTGGNGISSFNSSEIAHGGTQIAGGAGTLGSMGTFGLRS